MAWHGWLSGGRQLELSKEHTVLCVVLGGVSLKGNNCGYMRCAVPFCDYFKQSASVSKDLIDN